MRQINITSHKDMANSAKKQDPVIEGTTMSYWESWAHVAPGMLKRINGGNLNGKSDINPVWRFQALTQAFGPCGFGWTVTEVERWTDEAAGEIAVSVKVHLRINIGGTWSEPIEGVGGSKLCGKGHGDGINDEAWKMATTDAISVACKALGIAADVYTGRQSHSDADQRPDGPDYGTKYESRNYAPGVPRSSAPGNYTGQPQRGRQAPRNAAPAPEYDPGPVYAGNGQPFQAPPASDPNYQQPAQPPRNPSKVCEVVDVQKGRAVRLISELAKYDYDDPQSWAQGLAWLRNEVVLRDGAEALIVQLAVEKRNQSYQQQINQVFQK